MNDKELKINKNFYFTGAIFENGNIYLDINYEAYNDHFYSEIDKEKAQEIVNFLNEFIKG